jgi:hypothetical protein
MMQYLGEGMESVTVHKLLHQTLAKKCPSLTMSGFQFYLTSQKLSFMFILKKVFCTVMSSLTMFLCKAFPITRPTARKYSSFYNHIATEVLRGFPVSTSTDVFSLGVIIHSVGKKLPSACLESLGKRCKDSKSAMRPSVPELLRVLRENLQ